MTDDGQVSRRRYQRLAFVGALLLILGGLYALLHHYQGERRAFSKDRAVSFGVTVRAPQPGVPNHTMKVHQGDKVTLLIESELAGDFHLHGYDHEIALKPGSKARLAFEADRPGQFEIELHEPGGRHREVARLVVQP